MTQLVPLQELLEDAEVFTDGDWVESKDQDPNGDVRLIQLADIGDGHWINKSNRYLTSQKAKDLRCTYLKAGDVLVARMPDPIGRSCIFPGDSKPCVTVVDVCVIRPNAAKLDNRYLMHALNSPLGRQSIMGYVSGTTRQRISRTNLGKIEIPFFSLTEQKRIAAILDAADALRAKRRESIAQLDSLLQSTFLEMFGSGNESVSINEMLANGALTLHKDGNHGSLYPRANEFGKSGIPFLSAKCISAEGTLIESEVQFLNTEKASKLKIGWIENGDVLLAHNASVGKTLLYRGEFGKALIGTSLTAFRPNPTVLESSYLLGALRAPEFQAQLFANMGQTTRNQVPITAQRSLCVPFPPVDHQKKFAGVAESIEKQKARLRAHLNELDALFASLQSRAFKGEL